MLGLIKDLAGSLNQLSLNTLTFQRIDHWQVDMDLPVELKSPRKGLIIIKNKDEKFFLRCHVIHINPSKKQPDKTKINDKKLLKNLIIIELSFPFKKIFLARLK